MTGEELLEAQALIRRMPIGEKVVDAILNLVRNARPESAGGRGGCAAMWPGGRGRAPRRR